MIMLNQQTGNLGSGAEESKVEKAQSAGARKYTDYFSASNLMVRLQ